MVIDSKKWKPTPSSTRSPADSRPRFVPYSHPLSGLHAPQNSAPRRVAIHPALLVLFGLLLQWQPVPAAAQHWLYTVRPGDTLWEICKELTNQVDCAQRLATHNPEISDVRQLERGTQVRIPVEWLKVPPVPATVELVRGTAFVGHGIGNDQSRGAKNAKQHLNQLKAGTQVYMGDLILTRAGSVLLRFADGSTFLLKPDSELILERLSAHEQSGMVDTFMRLNRGSGRARVKSRNGKTRYQISTPAAIAAARGTDFSISALQDTPQADITQRSEVLEGLVDVGANGQQQAVDEGFGTVAETQAPPIPPVELLPAPQVQLADSSGLPLVVNWQAVTGAVAYSIDLFAGSDLNALVSSHQTSDTQLAISGIDAGDYTVIVRAVDALGLKGLEATAATNAALSLKAPDLGRNNAVLDGRKLDLDWAAVAGASAYTVQVSTSSSFKELVYEQQLEQTELSIELPAEGRYFYRIQAHFDGYGSSDFSPTQTVGDKDYNVWLLLLQTLGILAVLL